MEWNGGTQVPSKSMSGNGCYVQKWGQGRGISVPEILKRAWGGHLPGMLQKRSGHWEGLG